MKFSKHYLAALISFAIWGFSSLVLKPLQTYASLDILFYRVFFCAVIMLLIGFIFRSAVLKENLAIFKALPPEKRRKVITLTVCGGLLLTANWFFFIYAVNHISVKAGSLAYLVCPIMATLMAYFILQEKLNRWQWAAVGLSTLSCMLLSFNHLTDLLYSLVIATTYAGYLVSQRRNNELDKFLQLTIQIVVAAIVLIPFYPSQSAEVPTETTFYVLILVIVFIFTIAPLLMSLYALEGVNSSTMGILLYINPLIGFFIAVFHFHEEINVLQLTAYSLILVAIVIFNQHHLFKSRKKMVVTV